MKNSNKKAFTLVEAMAALLVMGIVTGGGVVTISNCLNSMINMRLEEEAVNLASENMEYLLAKKQISEFVESGTDEINPDLSWEIGFEVAEFPSTGKLWVRAFSTASYYNSENEYKEIQFEDWLMQLDDKEAKLVEQQREEEQALLDEASKEDSPNSTSQDSEEMLDETIDDVPTGSESSNPDNIDFDELIKQILENFGGA